MLRNRLLVPSQIALLVLLAISAAAKNSPHVIVVPVANMYSRPTEKSDVVSQAIYGSNVVLLQARGEWSKIQTPDHYKGWTPSRYLRIELTGNGYASSGPTVQVESLFANIYAEPDVTRHKPVITAPFETKLEVAPEGDSSKKPQQQHEGWLQVRLPGQTLAWIRAGDVETDPKPLSIPESIELAKRFLGLPYLWGGRSSFGFDCSGFTQMLVRARGIIMPRDADLQAAWSGVTAIERADLQPGDLLFFGSSVKDITHTGMYIGDGQFIHDTTHEHPVIQISKLDDEPWTKLLVACRRVKAPQ
ncbi:MAG: SH3 domain-containing C40 family peptidase [Candidatus Sulfotelmatobacter sp.]